MLGVYVEPLKIKSKSMPFFKESVWPEEEENSKAHYIRQFNEYN
jgi:hypothetical protein